LDARNRTGMALATVCSAMAMEENIHCDNKVQFGSSKE
jgi:hypothetical protein